MSSLLTSLWSVRRSNSSCRFLRGIAKTDLRSLAEERKVFSFALMPFLAGAFETSCPFPTWLLRVVQLPLR